MESLHKSDFAVMCRTLRVDRGLKQREVAEKIGVATTTYGNVESAPHKVISLDKANLIANLYELDQAARARLLDAWSRLPLSEYGERQREKWGKQNAQRSKAKNFDRVAASLVELCSLVLEYAPDGQLCVCDFNGRSEADPTRACEFCTALEALGIAAFTTKAKAIADLARVQERIDASRAKATTKTAK